jgi:hypothetical protein
MTVQRGTTVQMRVEVTDGGSTAENDDWKVRLCLWGGGEGRVI